MTDETIGGVLERNARRLVALQGVVGVAEGAAGGRACITVYVVERTAEVVAQIPSEVEGWPVVVRESGEFRSLM